MDESPFGGFLSSLTNPQPVAPEPEKIATREPSAFDGFLNQLDPSRQEKLFAQEQRGFAGQDLSRKKSVQFIPFGSAFMNWVEEKNYGAAIKRVNEGTGSDEDIKTIAEKQRREEVGQKAGLAQDVGHELTKIPALLGEFAVGGGIVRQAGTRLGLLGAAEAATPSLVRRGLTQAGIGAAATPFVPSTYLAQGAANQVANPSESVFQSYAPALGMAAAQNAILGQLQGGLNSIPTRLGRIGAKTAVGMAEAAAADVATTGLDRVSKAVTGYSLGLDTKWGTLGAVLRGDEGSMKQAAVQAMTFSVFSAMHSGWRPSEKAIRDFTKAADDLHKEGMSQEEAGKELLSRGEVVADALKIDPAAEVSWDADKIEKMRKDVAAHQDASFNAVSRQQEAERAMRKARTDSVAVPPESPPESPPAAPAEQPAEVPDRGPIVPQRGTPEAAAAKAALFERMRARQAAREPIPNPEKPDISVRPGVTKGGKAVPYEPIVGERPHDVEPPYNPVEHLNRLIDESNLSPREAHVARERINSGRSHESIAADPQAFGKKGTPVKRQMIEKVERKAMEKLGLEGSIADIHKQMAGLHELDMIEAGHRFEFKGDPVAAEKVGKKSIARREANIKERNALIKELLQIGDAIKRGERGPLSDAEREQFATRFSKLDQKASRSQHRRPAKDQAGEGRPVEAPPAKSAEAGNQAPAQPAKAKLTPEQRAAQNRKNLFKPQTLLGRLESQGGISPESAKNAGIDVPRMKEGPVKRLFKSGGRHIDDVMNELKTSGDLPNNIEHQVNLADVLMRKLEEGHLAIEQKGEHHIDKAIEAEFKQREAAEKARTDSVAVHDADDEWANRKAEEDAELDKERQGIDPDFDHHLSADFDPAHFEPLFDASGAPKAGRLTPREEAEHVVDEMIVGHDPTQAPGMGAMSAHAPTAPNTPAGQIQAKAADIARTAYSHVMGMVKSVADNWHELAGQIAPRLARMSEAGANAIARHIAGPAYVERAMGKFVEDVLGPITGHEGTGLPGEGTAADKRAVEFRYMAAAEEQRHRHTRQLLEADFRRFNELAKREPDPAKSAEWGNKAIQARMAAEKVTTFIGRENAQMDREADFQKTIAEPEFKAFKERWQTKFVPTAEKFYKMGEGYEPDDVLEFRTQLPDFVYTAKAVRGEGTDSVAVHEKGEAPGETGALIGSGRGKVTNVRQGKLQAAHEFGGSAKGYSIDPREIMANMMQDRVGKATKADLYRVLGREGLAQWDRKKSQIMLPDGRRMHELPVESIKGTQDAPAGSSLYVHPDAVKDVTRALGLNEPFKQIPGSGLLTKLSLLSLVEFATHGRNIATFIFKPGVSPIDIAKNFYGLLKDNPEVRAKLVDLAEIGGVKPKGSETGNLWGGKYDPTVYMSKALDLIDTTMRLTAADAFDRMVRTRGLKPSEFNKRNFVNQIGQYIKKGQNDIVSLFRDTGLGPFATAGTNYTVQGIRALFGDTGLKAPDLKTAALLRAEFFARVAAPFAVAAIANALLHKRPDGDDNTPIGGLKIGNDANGKTMYLDLGGMTGLPRGARTLGLLALLEGKRAGVGPNLIANRAARDVVGGLAHPFEGPAVSFVHGVATGENTIGMPIARKAGEGESQKLLDLQGALANSNPAYAAISGANRPNSETGIGEKAAGFLGPAAPKFRSTPPGGSLVDEVYDRFKSLENDRKRATAAGQRFEGEVRYRQMDQAVSRMSLIRKRMAVSSPAEKEKLGELLKQTAEAALSR